MEWVELTSTEKLTIKYEIVSVWNVCYFTTPFLMCHHNALRSCIFTLCDSHNPPPLQIAQSCAI